jgi:hypothetical protein
VVMFFVLRRAVLRQATEEGVTEGVIAG